MAARGPKIRTAGNASAAHPGVIRHETLAPPCPLSKAAQAEYDRLISLLRSKGSLDRIEIGIVAKCARFSATLDALYASDPDLVDRGSVSRAGILSSQIRGLLREIGLTVQPSRSLVKTSPMTPEEIDPIAGKIKLSG
jgi:phage terminase small subunit